MSDDKNRKFGFGGGFLGDALKDLQSEYSSEIAPRNKKKFPKAKINTKPANKTGRKTKALRKNPKELRIHFDIKLSNKLRFSGVGRQIVYIKDPYTVALTPLHPGEKETEAVNDFNIPADFSVSPDGLFLAVAGGEGKNTVYIYKLEWDLQYPGELQ